MSAAPRIDPKTVFTPDEWRGLIARSDVLGLGMVVHAWALIGLAAWLFAAFPNPLTWVLAVMVIGARQLGLAILMHEAAHAGLATNRALNDWVGQWLCAAPVGADLASYRGYHLRHHKYTQQPEDPDLELAAPFPVTPESFRRKAVRDLTGQTFFKQRIAPILAAASGQRGMPREGQVVGGHRAFHRYVIANAVVLALFALAGQGWAFVTLWMVAQATWFPFVTRLRNIAEHACLHDAENPWRHARTTRANWLERLLIAPYWVHFHAEHHLWPYLPAYRLAQAHRLLTTKGYDARMEIKPSYRAVLAEAVRPA
jgi:fatty acid desaturase